MAIVPSNGGMVPAAVASLKLRISREAVIRRIQRGQLDGVLQDGRWLVRLSEVDPSVEIPIGPKGKSRR